MSTIFIILLVILLIFVGIILLVNIGIRFAIFTARTVIDIIKSPASLFFIMCFIGFVIFVLVDMKKSPSGSSYDHGNDISVATEYKRALPETQEGPYQKSNEGEYKPNQFAQENHNYIMDSRDGKTYKIAKIGNQVWMAGIWIMKQTAAIAFQKNALSTDGFTFGNLHWMHAQLVGIFPPKKNMKPY